MENQDSSSAIVEQVPVENPDVQSTDVPVENSDVQSTDVPVDSPIRHHSVLSDHQLEVDGVIYRELKTLNRVVIQVFLQIINNLFSILAFRPYGLYIINVGKKFPYFFFSNFRMDQTLERMNKYLSTPDPLATRITRSKKPTLKALRMKKLKR